MLLGMLSLPRWDGFRLLEVKVFHSFHHFARVRLWLEFDFDRLCRESPEDLAELAFLVAWLLDGSFPSAFKIAVIFQ